MSFTIGRIHQFLKQIPCGYRRSAEMSAGNGHAAFVMGLGANGYGVVRSLVKAGVLTIGLYEREKEYGRLSKLCDSRKFDLIHGHQERACQRLIEWAAEFDKKPVVFATSDNHALFLATFKDELSKHFLFHWVAADTILEIADKSRVNGVCQDAEVLAPRTHITKADDDLAATAGSFQFPLIVKPFTSSGLSVEFPGHTFLANSLKDLLEFYAEYPNLYGSTIWQDIVEGKDSDVYQCNLLVSNSGEIRVVSCTRKIHQYPTGFGHMSFGRSEDNEWIISASRRMLDRVGYRGIASLEFKHEPKDGRYYFIEMNPRLPWYNSLFVASGVNLPYLSYLDLTKEAWSVADSTVQKNDVYWVCLRDELMRLVKGPERGSVLVWWLRIAWKTRAYPWWNLGDPRPFLLAVMESNRVSRFLLSKGRAIRGLF